MVNVGIQMLQFQQVMTGLYKHTHYSYNNNNSLIIIISISDGIYALDNTIGLPSEEIKLKKPKIAVKVMMMPIIIMLMIIIRLIIVDS